jgi:hypothetical protein
MSFLITYAEWLDEQIEEETDESRKSELLRELAMVEQTLHGVENSELEEA